MLKNRLALVLFLIVTQVFTEGLWSTPIQIQSTSVNQNILVRGDTYQGKISLDSLGVRDFEIKSSNLWVNVNYRDNSLILIIPTPETRWKMIYQKVSEKWSLKYVQSFPYVVRSMISFERARTASQNNKLCLQGNCGPRSDDPSQKCSINTALTSNETLSCPGIDFQQQKILTSLSQRVKISTDKYSECLKYVLISESKKRPKEEKFKKISNVLGLKDCEKKSGTQQADNVLLEIQKKVFENLPNSFSCKLSGTNGSATECGKYIPEKGKIFDFKIELALNDSKCFPSDPKEGEYSLYDQIDMAYTHESIHAALDQEALKAEKPDEALQKELHELFHNLHNQCNTQKKAIAVITNAKTGKQCLTTGLVTWGGQSVAQAADLLAAQEAPEESKKVMAAAYEAGLGSIESHVVAYNRTASNRSPTGGFVVIPSPSDIEAILRPSTSPTRSKPVNERLTQLMEEALKPLQGPAKIFNGLIEKASAETSPKPEAPLKAVAPKIQSPKLPPEITPSQVERIPSSDTDPQIVLPSYEPAPQSNPPKTEKQVARPSLQTPSVNLEKNNPSRSSSRLNFKANPSNPTPPPPLDDYLRSVNSDTLQRIISKNPQLENQIKDAGYQVIFTKNQKTISAVIPKTTINKNFICESGKTCQLKSNVPRSNHER